ncbi:iron ABC transporter substrate-binding protein [[Mycobacterium] burgundiense]|uniref:Iron ABC transporter substrate-binding protein n=1 Tax=[Mycobacterium] burgundiense TaxID=3064286 RepID=A0ABN9NAE0_9MYCO|nr:iron ABC transporter substrate-binding protein [Mycolicibacterium sp. MU0053]CAJ1503085.1 iron ABC transporter substrate-binding protein [Mycolicibacterium sp. MU0053]
MAISRSTFAAGFAAIAMLAMSACGGGTESEPAATETTTGATEAEEQKVVVYSGRSEDLVAPLLEQFTSDTGIDVEVRYAGSGELAAQLITEGDQSPADVFFSQDAGALGAVSNAGLFAPIAADTLAAVPTEYSAADGTWVGVSGRARVIVYNPELAPTPPDTIDGLLAPEWKGQIGFAPSNASWQSFVTALRVLRGEDGAAEWLRAFKAQDPRPYEGNGAVRDAVDSGQVALGLVNHYYLYELIESKGADNVVAQNQFMAPADPGGLVNVAGVGVLKSAPNPDAAQEFAAYLVGESAQKFFATETAEYPLIAGVEPGSEMPPLADLDPPAVDLSSLDDLEATQQLLVETGLLTN